jgi:hypothetical protein
MALQRKWIASPNYSSRGGSGVRLIVLHTAEGATTIESLGSYFSNPSSQVSSHTGIDDKAGVIGEYVKRGNKAWTQGNANPVCVSTELCAFAKWSAAEWGQHQTMLNNCAAWIAEEAAAYGIPITRLSASQAQGSGRGICQHVDLGSWGGGHWDCGTGFPMDDVLNRARGGAAAPPSTAPAPPPSGGAAPPWPGTYLRNFTQGGGTRQWQAQMQARGWSITVDDMYGGQSESVCRQFQSEKGLAVDGVVGPQTWGASWTAVIT